MHHNVFNCGIINFYYYYYYLFYLRGSIKLVHQIWRTPVSSEERNTLWGKMDLKKTSSSADLTFFYSCELSYLFACTGSKHSLRFYRIFYLQCFGEFWKDCVLSASHQSQGQPAYYKQQILCSEHAVLRWPTMYFHLIMQILLSSSLPCMLISLLP